MRGALSLLVVLAMGCGRTQTVRYPKDASASLEMPFDPVRLADGGVACVTGTVELVRAFPVVTLVVDRSSSMNQRWQANGPTKWVSLRASLSSALPAFDDELQLGLSLFPTPGAFDGCSVSTGQQVANLRHSVSTVLRVVNGTAPAGATPTALALENAAAILARQRTASGAKSLILATDGAPDCNGSLDPRSCTCVSGTQCNATRCLDDARSVATVQGIAAAGIPVWIIGLRSANDEAFVDVLNRMAVAGGKPTSGTQRFYSAESEAQLTQALTAIGRQVGECHYLTRSVPDQGGTIDVTVGGDIVPRDESGREGWSWVDPGNGELQLHGEACARARALLADELTAIVQCGQ